VIFPSPQNFDKKVSFVLNKIGEKGKKVNPKFEYESGSNKKFLTLKEIKDWNKKYL
jgi:hypothetical protein